MREKCSSTKNHTQREWDFLLCDMAHEARSPFPFGKWVSSPIKCFDMAVDGSFGIIVVRFGRISIRDRETLLELSVALKRNSHTRGYTTLALLNARHRGLIDNLAKAKVDYIRYIGDAKLDSFQMRQMIEDLGPDDRVDKHLATLCPFLRYKAIDSHHEMAVCEAYLNRLVLGGHRLQGTCETEDHLQCEYYLYPRCAP